MKWEFTLEFIKVMFPIFEQISVGFEAFEIFLATMKSMLHLNLFTIRIDTVQSLPVVYPLKMWKADLFNFKHVFLLEFCLKMQVK